MKKYTPVNCSFHDHIEHFAVLRKAVKIRYQQDDAVHEIQTRIKTWVSETEGEFVILEKEDLKIRMDYLISIDDLKLSDFNMC